ncbi:hypothetical protein B566_EDAN012230 [Ephemera danica]|nr:hypothetical protein B566_EDAN012230 [Ephemera danica]
MDDAAVATEGSSRLMVGWVDVCVFTSMLVASAVIGCYFGCKPKSAIKDDEDFISGITMLGLPSEVYRHGTQYWTTIISVQFVCWTIAHYLEMRFDSRVRKVASLLFVLSIVNHK